MAQSLDSVQAPSKAPLWRAASAALLLGGLVAAAAVRDSLTAPPQSHVALSSTEEELDPLPRLEIRFHDEKRDDELEKLWLTKAPPTMRFGLVMLRNGQEIGTGAQVRRLTFDPWGRTNNTCLRFDDKDERLFGGSGGRWEERGTKVWKDEQGQPEEGVRSVWVCDDKKIKVTQLVTLVRGTQSRLLDTCRVHYRLDNSPSGVSRRVGLRFLLDSFIGGNDGVPFTIPGNDDLCDTMRDLPAQAAGQKLPDFLQALEKPDLARPGTIAHLRLRLEGLEAPARVTLGAWPNEKLQILARQADGPATRWEVPLLPMKSAHLDDSAVTIYWKEEPLQPGGRRDVGFEYGLWNLASQGSRLAATVDGAFRPDGELTVVAYVHRADEEQGERTATLTLPESFKLLDGTPTQPVPALPAGVRDGNVPVTWKVRAGATGRYELQVSAGAGVQTLRVEIRQSIY